MADDPDRSFWGTGGDDGVPLMYPLLHGDLPALPANFSALVVELDAQANRRKCGSSAPNRTMTVDDTSVFELCTASFVGQQHGSKGRGLAGLNFEF